MKTTGKDHARVNLAIWGDDDFLDLTTDEQLLYLALWTSPSLTYCGSGDWHPGRVANLASDWTTERVNHAAAGLSAALFVIFDTETDEFLIRSWIKHDGLWKTPNMAVSMANARASLASRTLRGVVVHEVQKVRDAHPDSSSWAKPAVASLLEQRPVNPYELIPLRVGVNPPAKGSGQPLDFVTPNPGPNPPSTPAPSPAPISGYEKSGGVSESDESQTPVQSPPRKRGTRLPDGWMPDQPVIDSMKLECPAVDLQAEHRKFVDYWQAKTGKDATKLDWNATWRNWIRRATPSAHTHHDPTRSGWDDLKTATSHQLGA